MRYNLIVNSGNAIYVLGDPKDYPADGTIYNNTALINSGHTGLTMWGYINAVKVYNNAFIGLPNTSVGFNLFPTATASLDIRNNGYYSPSAPFSFGYQYSQNNPYTTSAGIGPFRSATGQEGGTRSPVGIETNPQLNNIPGTAPTIGIANAGKKPQILSQYYQLPSSSPFQTGALNLQNSLGINPGTHDFWCNPVSAKIGI